MKISVLAAASILLLKSVVAALPQHNPDRYDPQLVYQPIEKENLAKTIPIAIGQERIKSSIVDEPDPPSAQIPQHKKHTSPVGTDQRSSTHASTPAPPSHNNKDTSTNPPFTRHKQWAMVYFPYNDDSTCKSLLSIRSDIAKIARKGFNSIRLHATDCSALERVGQAAALHGLKLILGVHIDEDSGIEQAKPQIEEIISWANGDWKGVEMVVMGEEAIANQVVGPRKLAAFIAYSKNILRKAGYSGPVTTTEPVAVLVENADVLCPVLDIAATNVHPFFHSEAAELAGEYVRDTLAQLAEVCPNISEAVNLETGWPRRGRRNGAAIPGVMEQMVAVTGILKEAGGRSVMLGFGDDGWKDEGEFGVEGSWGCEGLFAEV